MRGDMVSTWLDEIEKIGGLPKLDLTPYKEDMRRFHQREVMKEDENRRNLGKLMIDGRSWTLYSFEELYEQNEWETPVGVIADFIIEFFTWRDDVGLEAGLFDFDYRKTENFQQERKRRSLEV